MSSTVAAAGEQIYATLLLNDTYLPGALVLAHSLRDAGTKRKLAVLTTLDTVSADAITQLQTVYDYILPVPRIRNERSANLHLMNRADLHSAFTKINLWKLTQFSKIVYLDADVIAYRAPDELFGLTHSFSAAPDVGWPDIVNTGVMALTPSMGDYYAMLAMAERGISFDGADQGLINMHFQHGVNRISFTYNVTPSAHYQYVPAYRHFQSSINLVHFIGTEKPWLSDRQAFHGNGPFDEMVGRWWAIHDRHYRAQTTVPQHSKQGLVNQGPGQVTSSAGISDEGSLRNRSGQTSAQGEQNTSSQTDHAHTSRITATSSSEGQSSVHNDTGPTHWPAENERQSPHVPMNDWDAQRQSPPPDSKPEAINFPSAHYEMSRDPKPFVPPVRYPSPPKNMWYEVPQEPPSSSNKPRHIFPWEKNQPAASRSFVEATPPPAPEPLDAAKPSSELISQSNATASGTGDAQSVTEAGVGDVPLGQTDVVTSPTSGNPWNFFSQANAWDEVPEIGRYVEGLQRHRRVKSRTKTPPSESIARFSEDVANFQIPRVLRVTDFPTEMERPSLPVTPAPIRRPSFWGEDKGDHDAAAESRSLPMAAGVPMQSEWDPAAQLQKLAQQQSEALLRKLSGDEGMAGSKSAPFIPSRQMPFGSEPLLSPSYVAESPSSSVLSPRPIPVKTPAAALVESFTSTDDPSAPSSATTTPPKSDNSETVKA